MKELPRRRARAIFNHNLLIFRAYVAFIKHRDFPAKAIPTGLGSYGPCPLISTYLLLAFRFRKHLYKHKEAYVHTLNRMLASGAMGTPKATLSSLMETCLANTFPDNPGLRRHNVLHRMEFYFLSSVVTELSRSATDITFSCV